MIRISHFLKTGFRKLNHHHHYLKILFAFLDQGIFSASNFIVNILLARWLSDIDYGAFAVSYAVYIFASTIQGALILEPISVFGTEKEAVNLSGYFNKQLIFHIQINLLVGLLVFVSSLFTLPPVRNSLIGAALAIPLTLLVWLYRRFCYVRMQTGLATLISFVYSVSLFSGIFLFSSYMTLSPLLVYCLMGIASVISVLLLGVHLDLKFNLFDFIGKIFLFDAQFYENWLYGKWILLAMIADSIVNLVYIPLIAIFLGLHQAGGFRAMQNFLMPIQQLQAAISLMIVPWLSRKAIHSKSIFDYKNLFLITFCYLLPSVLYSLPIMVFSKPLLEILYKSSTYDDYIWMIPYLLVSSILYSFSLSFAVSFRAIRFTKPILLSKMSASFVTIIFGGLFTYYFKFTGVIIVLYISIIVEILVLYMSAIRRKKNQRKLA